MWKISRGEIDLITGTNIESWHKYLWSFISSKKSNKIKSRGKIDFHSRNSPLWLVVCLSGVVDYHTRVCVCICVCSCDSESSAYHSDYIKLKFLFPPLALECLFFMFRLNVFNFQDVFGEIADFYSLAVTPCGKSGIFIVVSIEWK